MSLIEKQRELIDDFSIIEDPVERFSAIVDRGKHALPLPEEARRDETLVPGCTSRVWLTGWLGEEKNDRPRCQFRVEADAPSVHGVAALLCDLYSGATPEEISAVEPECLTALGIDRQLTPTRMRGLGQVRKRIRDIAESLAAEDELMSAFPHLDAHLHLQDERLQPHLEGIVSELRQLGITRWVVNGTSETDWPRVAELAKTCPEVLPAYGLHPWFVKDRTAEWEETLSNYLSHHAIAVGEIGLDKWIRDHDIEDQETVFRRQLRLAAAIDLPVVIHCLKAWGRLLDVLRSESLPSAGFLLHSFAGPREMIEDFTALGARFSFSGHFLRERKAEVVETFRHIPRDRILIETDAPDMALPENLETHPLTGSEGQRLNHPANLLAVYRGLAEALQISEETLATHIAKNFELLFGNR